MWHQYIAVLGSWSAFTLIHHAFWAAVDGCVECQPRYSNTNRDINLTPPQLFAIAGSGRIWAFILWTAWQTRLCSLCIEATRHRMISEPITCMVMLVLSVWIARLVRRSIPFKKNVENSFGEIGVTAKLNISLWTTASSQVDVRTLAAPAKINKITRYNLRNSFEYDE